MNTNKFRRTLVGAVVVAGALGLTACNSDAPTVNTTDGGTSTATTTTDSSTGEATQQETSPSSGESSQTSSESSETTESAETSTGSGDGPTTVTDAKATLQMGQPAVIEDDGDTFRLTPKSLEVAPDSVFSETKLKKSDGTVYYLKFDVAAIKTNSTYFGSNSVNGLFFHPEIDPSLKGAKRLYGDTSECSSESKELAAGESTSSCYIYQIPGETVSNVVYSDSDHHIRWTK